MRKSRRSPKTQAKVWENYEQVAQFLLNQFAQHFKLGKIEGKQKLPAKRAGNWEIDAKGVKVDGQGFLVVECRRHTTSRLNKKDLAHLAYVIEDTGAQGGITVSPL